MEILYTTIESVKVRLAGKVQFQSEDEPLDGELPNDFLKQLISDAEVDVEMDLRSRYAIPFRSICHGTYDKLPDHTKRAIRNAVDLMAVVKILDTDFGRGTHINAEGYADPNRSAYNRAIERLLGHDKNGKELARFKFSPPLEDLLLAKSNKEADDGYRGMIINTDASTNDSASYAARQVNDPARSFWKPRSHGVF